jgi:hypothetical protein
MDKYTNIRRVATDIHGGSINMRTKKHIPYDVYVDKMTGLVRGEQYVIVDNINPSLVGPTYVNPESTEYQKPMTSQPPSSLTYHTNQVPADKQIIYEDQQARINEFKNDGL